MAPGGRICKEVPESHSMFSDYGIATSNGESKISPSTKTPIVPGGKYVFSSTTGVHDLLECPVCMSSMYPPIHQCPNGHTLCSDCKARVHNCCPTCRYELGNIRCLALEKVAESLELPCRHQALGCHDIFPYYSKLQHEQHCRYRPYNCPYAGSECSVTGDIPILVGHLKDDHKVDTHDGCTFNHRYVKSNPQEVENATWMLTDLLNNMACLGSYDIFCLADDVVVVIVMEYKKYEYVKTASSMLWFAYRGLARKVFNCFGRQFCLHFEAFQMGMAPVYMAFLRFMGDEDDAKKFSYSLEVGGNGRKLMWQGVPRSIRDSHRKVRDSQDGLIIQRNLALFFSGGDRQELKLRVTGRIWKEQ
ncbi:hypothetical protein C5167_003418 [Papaver somniferum]|uniref:RING-type E3 ubiquitin transferase n=2 Tax=Papaver TaxID=3468 RepID=A0A4Y7L4B4_PAPSO|nr:hypothetical protein C5167_003418 [Papaver somniferum]